MSYLVKRFEGGGNGSKVFWRLVIGTIIIGIAFFAITPPAFNDCKTIDSTLCACPKNPEDIKTRSLIIVDTTDKLRDGKQPDIDLLISTFSGGRKSLVDWILDGKRADQTSIFLLGSVAPPDMKPVATFCSLPPSVAMLASDLNGQQIRLLEEKTITTIKDSIIEAFKTSAALQSPIIEALAVATGNASHWTPGGNLILVSDLLQNTNECGFFDGSGAVPPFKAISHKCRSHVENLHERLRSTTIYPDVSVVALCTLPGKPYKSGLLSFWRELFQEGLSYDVAMTCDPQEIKSRRKTLSSLNKRDLTSK